MIWFDILFFLVGLKKKMLKTVSTHYIEYHHYFETYQKHPIYSTSTSILDGKVHHKNVLFKFEYLNLNVITMIILWLYSLLCVSYSIWLWMKYLLFEDIFISKDLHWFYGNLQYYYYSFFECISMIFIIKRFSNTFFLCF